MDKIVLNGCDHHDGEYELDMSSLTHRELHTIKRVSGVRIGELEEAAGANDTDVMVALAIIAIQRQGRLVDEDALWDSDVGAIVYQEDKNAVVAPVNPTLQPEPTANGGGSGNVTSISSGSLPESPPSPTGVQT